MPQILFFPVKIWGWQFPILMFGGLGFLLVLSFQLMRRIEFGAVWAALVSSLLVIVCSGSAFGLFVGGGFMGSFGGAHMLGQFVLMQGVGGLLGWLAAKLLLVFHRQEGEQVP